MNISKNKNTGFGVIEIVIAVGIIAIAVVALLIATNGFLRLSRDATNNLQANFLVQEGIEAIRSMRDSGWSDNIGNLATETDYWLYFDGSIWTATTTTQIIDETYERKFIISDVYRDANDDISDSGSLENGTKQFDVSVEWESVRGGTASTTKTTYITDLFND